MLLNFYGLREQPFGVTPDPAYLYLSPTHREALASLQYGLESGRGFMALIAKPGMGKTSLLFQLLKQLQGASRTVFLFQTFCDARELMRYLLVDLGVDNCDGDLVQMHTRLNELLVQEATEGKRVVVVIDEAQNLEPGVMELVRMLSNFETPRSKLIQIILAGQPGLAAKLAEPAMVQLGQRISVLARLDPLGPEEVDRYIDHRLAVAGFEGGPLFTREARALIAGWSQGIPRLINDICFSALSLGYADGLKTIGPETVREAVADLNVNNVVRDMVPRSRKPRGAAIWHFLRRFLRRFTSADLGTLVLRPIHVLALAIFLAGLLGAVMLFTRTTSPSKSALPPALTSIQEPGNSLRNLGSLPAERPGIVPVIAAAAVQKEPVEVETFTVVVVKPNQTLSQIGRQYFGTADPQLIREICELNPEITDPDQIAVGQRIRLPLAPDTEKNGISADAEDTGE
jgi:type II secretory pathway predicted ATPase ExeA